MALPRARFKKSPEDFVVEEIDAYPASGEGTHTLVRIQKRGLTTDVALSYALTNQLRLSVGSSNLFNVYPSFFNPQATENGGAWDAVQMGSNGRFVFAKLQFRVSKQ